MKIFDYKGIQLIPNKCIVNSRSEYDTTVALGKHTFRMPIVPANVQAVVDETIAGFLAENGYFYIMHQFDEIARIPSTKKIKKHGLVTSISVGVRKEEYPFIERSAEESLNPGYITIDIAHGHANSIIDMIQHIKKYLPETFATAGSVGTPEAVRELENTGANITKVGTGPGKVCVTKIRTGFGTGDWQLAALRWRTKTARKPIIADGGVRTHGGIAESVRFGATMVMTGLLFVGHEESPGKTKVESGIVYEEYFGSIPEFQEGEERNVEGKKIWIQRRGSLRDTLVGMQQDLQSSISYAGGGDLESARKVNYVIVRNSIFNGDTI